MADAALDQVMDRQRGRRLFFALLLVIVVGSLTPEDESQGNAILSLNWNGAHIPAYFLLTLGAMLARVGGSGLRLLLTSAGVTSLIGGVIEIIQPHFGRTMSFGDALGNEVGVTLAVAAAWWFGWQR